jgi:HNH endonuclease
VSIREQIPLLEALSEIDVELARVREQLRLRPLLRPEPAAQPKDGQKGESLTMTPRSHASGGRWGWKDGQEGESLTMTQLEAKKKRLKADRVRKAGRLPRDLLLQYESIRARHPVAIAKAEARPFPTGSTGAGQKGLCSICRSSLPAAMFAAMRLQEAFDRCPKCGRILYYPGSDVRLPREETPAPVAARSGASAPRPIAARPVPSAAPATEPTADPDELDERVRLLRKMELERPAGQPRPRRLGSGRSATYERRADVKAWVLREARGRCELCCGAAPFKGFDGEPYLELHHVRQLADEGPDTPENAVALCANCHRCLHYGAEREGQRARLYEQVKRLVRCD